jgi:hypothetical protein
LPDLTQVLLVTGEVKRGVDKPVKPVKPVISKACTKIDIPVESLLDVEVARREEGVAVPNLSAAPQRYPDVGTLGM